MDPENRAAEDLDRSGEDATPQRVESHVAGSAPRDGELTALGRDGVAALYIRGEGIEIGALHQPQRVSGSATVKYVDRMSAQELREQYADLAGVSLVDPDIIDDGETLATIADASRDFVIASHFLEHCQNPIGAVRNMLRVLRPGGILLLVVPDKRCTFDVDRPCTTVGHLLRDYAEGPGWSKRRHFEDWSRLVNKCDESRVEEEVEHLIGMDYSIHYHVWTQAELLECFLVLRKMFGFELELFMKNGTENIVVLRK